MDGSHWAFRPKRRPRADSFKRWLGSPRPANQSNHEKNQRRSEEYIADPSSKIVGCESADYEQETSSNRGPQATTGLGVASLLWNSILWCFVRREDGLCVGDLTSTNEETSPGAESDFRTAAACIGNIHECWDSSRAKQILNELGLGSSRVCSETDEIAHIIGGGLPNGSRLSCGPGRPQSRWTFSARCGRPGPTASSAC
jgi:hypothetical protein